MEAISNATDFDLVRKISVYLQENHPNEVAALTRDELDRRIRLGLTRARRYDLEIDSHLLLFVVLMFSVSPTFDEHPKIRLVFENTEIGKDDKLAALPNYVDGDDWIEIRQSASGAGWP